LSFRVANPKKPGAKKPRPLYVRVGISGKDDRKLDRIAEIGFKGALDKKDVGRLIVQFALAHWEQMADWYRQRGADVIAQIDTEEPD
jgi:hypothetical protein